MKGPWGGGGKCVWSSASSSSPAAATTMSSSSAPPLLTDDPSTWRRLLLLLRMKIRLTTTTTVAVVVVVVVVVVVKVKVVARLVKRHASSSGVSDERHKCAVAPECHAAASASSSRRCVLFPPPLLTASRFIASAPTIRSTRSAVARARIPQPAERAASRRSLDLPSLREAVDARLERRCDRHALAAQKPDPKPRCGRPIGAPILVLDPPNPLHRRLVLVVVVANGQLRRQGPATASKISSGSAGGCCRGDSAAELASEWTSSPGCFARAWRRRVVVRKHGYEASDEPERVDDRLALKRSSTLLGSRSFPLASRTDKAVAEGRTTTTRRRRKERRRSIVNECQLEAKPWSRLRTNSHTGATRR